jgi:hypothetical protein
MGQYYKPCQIADKKAIEWIYSHDVQSKFTREDGKSFMMGEGLKLMEHSYIGNKLMLCVEKLLIPGGAWYKKPIVWAGDYAAPEEGSEDNLYSMSDDGREDGEQLSFKIENPKPLSQAQSKKHRFIVNHTTKQFVDKDSVPDRDGWKIHPLSLLTAEGNGGGGGDFRGRDSKDLIGSWARNIISMEKEIPTGYKELKFNLKE